VNSLCTHALRRLPLDYKYFFHILPFIKFACNQPCYLHVFFRTDSALSSNGVQPASAVSGSPIRVDRLIDIDTNSRVIAEDSDSEVEEFSTRQEKSYKYRRYKFGDG
jgi:hypothetical protein